MHPSSNRIRLTLKVIFPAQLQINRRGRSNNWQRIIRRATRVWSEASSEALTTLKRMKRCCLPHENEFYWQTLGPNPKRARPTCERS